MRIKRGAVKNRKHKKLLKLAKGYRMSYSKLYRRAKEAVRHAGQYSFAHRRRRPSQKRREWIATIASALAGTGVSYSTFIGNLKTKNIELDRKSLAHIAELHPEHFTEIVKASK